MAEFHPVIWMFDNNFTKVAYNYFKDEPIIEEVREARAALAAEHGDDLQPIPS